MRDKVKEEEEEEKKKGGKGGGEKEVDSTHPKFLDPHNNSF